MNLHLTGRGTSLWGAIGQRSDLIELHDAETMRAVSVRSEIWILLPLSLSLSRSIAIPKVQLRLKFGYVHTEKYKFTRIITLLQ